MTCKVAVLLFVVGCLVPVWCKEKKLARLMADPLSKTRCDLMCHDVEKEKKLECRTQCKSQEIKPGSCPASEHSKWAEACVEACNNDAQCDGTQRCCTHGCTKSCNEPTDLLSWPGLPALPAISDPMEKKRAVVVRWSDGVGDLARNVPGRVLYLLEEQHHLGPKYEEARLGDWNLLLRTNKTKVSLRNLLKPGRWYRFRVAAVSAAGTRGYSSPSAAFTPRKGPRAPPPPTRLRVHPGKADNGSISIRLEWKEPRSDLPIMRYKVYWSRRVRGLDGELDSVLVNHQTVPKEQTYADITDLQPHSMYFLQVQSISQYGLTRLRSDKASIFYNTTNNDNTAAAPLRRRTNKIKGLKLQKVIWNNHSLKALLTWKPLPKQNGKPRRYYVRWVSTNCDDKPTKSRKELSAITEQTSFEIYELEYRCKYKVNVNRSASRSKTTTDSEISVKVPSCEYFQQKLNGTKIDCNT